jgi:hypothetical protein
MPAGSELGFVELVLFAEEIDFDVVLDLAGSPGSLTNGVGKSVAGVICAVLYKATPSWCCSVMTAY